jgi:Aldehyde dehydrogenase family
MLITRLLRLPMARPLIRGRVVVLLSVYTCMKRYTMSLSKRSWPSCGLINLAFRMVCPWRSEADGGDASTTIGPVVSTAAAARIRKQVSDALADGAKAEIPTDTFPLDKEGSTFVGPQVLTNVTHKMSTSPHSISETQVSCATKLLAPSSGL